MMLILLIVAILLILTGAAIIYIYLNKKTIRSSDNSHVSVWNNNGMVAGRNIVNNSSGVYIDGKRVDSGQQSNIRHSIKTRIHIDNMNDLYVNGQKMDVEEEANEYQNHKRRRLMSIEEIQRLNHPYEDDIIRDFKSGVAIVVDSNNNVNCRFVNNCTSCYNSRHLNNCTDCANSKHLNNCKNCENVKHLNNQTNIVKKDPIEF